MNENNDYNMSLGKNLKPAEQISDMHVCTFCETKFNNVNSLNLHCQFHDNNKNFICLMCKEVFFDLQQLKLHDLRHSIEEAHGDASNIENISFSVFISCSFCGEKFSSDEELINHCVVHPIKDADISCTETPDLEDLNSESCDSDDEEQLSYRILRQEIINPKNGRSHKQLIRLTLIDEHDVQVEEFTRIIKPPKISKGKKLVKANNIPKKIKAKPKAFYKENKSDKVREPYDNAKVISKKVKAITNNLEVTSNNNKQENKDLSDNECEVVFDKVISSSNKQERKSKLVAIRKKLWNDKIELPTMRKIFSRAQNKFVYKCKKCRVVFNRLDALNRHKEKDCSLPNLRVCRDCNKSFTNLSEYNRHCQAHKEIGKFSCHECKEEFTTKSMYRQHVIDHHDSSEKSQYDCRICNEHFVIKYDLDSHWHKHLNLKKFICCQCQRTFNSLPIFKIHVCSRDNVCYVCKKVFSRRSHLLRHLRNVHKLDITNGKSLPINDSSVKNSSSVVVNGGKLEHVSDSSAEPKLQSEEAGKITKVEDSDTEDKSHIKGKEAVSNNSRMTNNSIMKTSVTKKANSVIKSNVSMKRKVKSSDTNHNHARPSKKPKLKISESTRKPINKKVLLTKKTSVMNVKAKSKMSATRYSIPPQRKQPVKKLTMKSSKKPLPVKKASNRFMNKSVISKKSNQKKSSINMKKNLVQKKAGKSVSTLNSVRKLKKSK